MGVVDPGAVAAPETEPASADGDQQPPPTLTRRQLALRDSIAFLSLAVLVALLFTATLFLFRSFTARRALLAARWLDRGRVSLAQGRPEDAIRSLRVTLDYSPDDADTQFLLAQALAQAGHLNEANNYLLELWTTRPGSGPINLARARLAAREGSRDQAVEFFRAAIYGTWEGDGVTRRREIRLELARFLLDQHETDAARADLLVAGGNTSGDADADLAIASLLERADDPAAARRLYLRAAANPARRREALRAAAEIDFRNNNFVSARHLLQNAARAGDAERIADPLQLQITSRLRLLDETVALIPSPDLSDGERVDRILRGRSIAHARLLRCEAAGGPEIASLVAAWSARDGAGDRRSLLGSPDRQQAADALNRKTEEITTHACPADEAPTPADQALRLSLRAREGDVG